MSKDDLHATVTGGQYSVSHLGYDYLFLFPFDREDYEEAKVDAWACYSRALELGLPALIRLECHSSEVLASTEGGT